MSKAQVRKAIKDFDAEQLRDLILDLYDKSKDSKEVLDFFANPDLEKKMEKLKEKLRKEATRFSRHAFRPRLPKLRAPIKHFQKLFEPGAEAVGELMFYVVETMLELCNNSRNAESFYVTLGKFSSESFDFLIANGLMDDYKPRLRKITGCLKPLGFMRSSNPAKRVIEELLKSKAVELN